MPLPHYHHWPAPPLRPAVSLLLALTTVLLTLLPLSGTVQMYTVHCTELSEVGNRKGGETSYHIHINILIHKYIFPKTIVYQSIRQEENCWGPLSTNDMFLESVFPDLNVDLSVTIFGRRKMAKQIEIRYRVSHVDTYVSFCSKYHSTLLVAISWQYLFRCPCPGVLCLDWAWSPAGAPPPWCVMTSPDEPGDHCQC